MGQAAAATRAGSAGARRYARHRPEQTLLYRIVAQHYPAFVELLAGQGRPLPDYVQQEFEAYLKCGRLEHGFLRVRCESCHARALGGLQLQAARVLPQMRRPAHGGERGAARRRVYVERPDGSLTFRWVKAPTSAELTALAGRIASRVGRFLERQGLLERDAESASLSEIALDDEPMQGLLAHSITYRIAVGPRAGRKVFTLAAPAGRR